MEISMRDLWTVLHGMGFGALFMLAFSGAIMELYGGWSANPLAPYDHRGKAMLRVYLISMVVLAWGTVFSGAYIVYPWYRAAVPAGTIDLAGFPQKLLMSSGDQRRAQLRHGMERARGLDCTDRHDDGGLRLLEVWPRHQQAS
jgi:hypothetical protein